jgi:hypothetical protein
MGNWVKLLFFGAHPALGGNGAVAEFPAPAHEPPRPENGRNERISCGQSGGLEGVRMGDPPLQPTGEISL